MRDYSGNFERWNHTVGRHDWYSENEFESFRPPRRYYRTSPGPSVPHHHHENQEKAPQSKKHHRRPGFNRFSEHANRYILKYDFGRGRYNATYGDGYAGSPRSDDRDWDNGRNVYWRERYHHQGHDVGDQIRFQNDKNLHRRGYSSNFRDSGRGSGWRIDDEYYRH